jgi:hypothetical protein
MNINLYKKNEIKNICQKINTKIYNNISFFNNNYIKAQVTIKTKIVNKYFYQMSTTLIKFAELSVINTATIELLLDLFNSIDSLKENNIRELLKYNLIYFLSNSQLYKNNDELQMESLNNMMKNLLKTIQIQSKKQSDFIKKIYNKKFINQLLSFIWLIDDNEDNKEINYNDNNNIIIENNKRNKSELFMSTSDCYCSVLIEILKLDIYKKEEEMNEKMLLLYYFFDKALEYKEKNASIFANMLLILFKTNLVKSFDVAKIRKIIIIIKEELKKKWKKSR